MQETQTDQAHQAGTPFAEAPIAEAANVETPIAETPIAETSGAGEKAEGAPGLALSEPQPSRRTRSPRGGPKPVARTPRTAKPAAAGKPAVSAPPALPPASYPASAATHALPRSAVHPYLSLMRQWREISLFWPTAMVAQLNDAERSQAAFKALADANMRIWGKAARASGFSADPDTTSPMGRVLALWDKALPRVSFYRDAPTPEPHQGPSAR